MGPTGIMAGPGSWQGSTSKFIQVRPGVVLKYPLMYSRSSVCQRKRVDEIMKSFTVERQILEVLGEHPRIVRCFGWQEQPGTLPGLLLAEASHSSLQQCLITDSAICLPVRKKWCLQAVEAIVYIHSCGVIHSDLRPDNFLVHATVPTSLDLWLCDFGGSMCEKLGLDGGHLPDSGFFDPNAEWVSTEQTDIFSLASLCYTILTGHWPYRSSVGLFKSGEEMDNYRELVDTQFKQHKFPDVNGLSGGAVIIKCWMNEYKAAKDFLQALRLEWEI